MSAGKKKSPAKLQAVFEEIKDLLIKTKPKLNDISVDDPSAVDGLHQIASLAQSFTELRTKSSTNWSELTDILDQEGVNLWNVSGIFRQGSDHDSRTIVAALRLAGFRLMEAGLESKPNIEALLHVLQIASKAGSTLSELGNVDTAACVLACAAKYEEMLRTLDDPQDVHQQAKARVTTVYYTSRMEAAWREKNEGLATFMSEKVTENDRRLALLAVRDRELLASKLLDIGKSLLRECYQNGAASMEGSNANNALRWMQKAFSVIEPLDCAESPGLPELKRSILRSLARGFFLSSSRDPENLNRAEAALEEVIAGIDSSVDHASSEYQQLRWMKLAVLKRRKAGDTMLLPALQSIIDNMTFSESNLADLLQELRTVTQHTLVTAATQHCLRRALGLTESITYVERLVLSLIFHCSKDDDHARAIQDVGITFKELAEADIEMPKVSSTACLTLIWQYGDRHYHAARWKEAADWFICGTHAIFRSLGSANSAKCFRKAALCHLQQKEYAQAASIIRRCPSNEATTRYVVFLIAVHQGLEDEAIMAVRNMVEAPDFDRKMLLLACRLSHEFELKALLLSVLKALLDTLTFRENMDTVTEAMTLIRCIIRLILKLLGEPAANISVLVHSLLEYFANAKTLVQSAALENSALVIKDISWLWRTAYNSAIQGCADWEHCEEQISQMFDIARQLLEIYISNSLIDVDAGIYLCLINSSFASVSGQVISVRELLAQGKVIEYERFHTLMTEIKSCKGRILRLVGQNRIAPDNMAQAHSFLHILQVFEVETCCRIQDWDSALATIEGAIQSDSLALITFEAFADILWEQKECPVHVLFAALEAILQACLTRGCLSVEKFSRWLRSTCTILLSRNMSSDRMKAIGYMEQAIAVLEEHGDLRTTKDILYPIDERHWLLSTAYNTGIECLHGSLIDEAKRWFECSTIICRFVPDGKRRAEKISETYTSLLAHYGTR
ncbi:meiosis protein SPO22/ZIP4 like-domain-containing protein [Hygrophoropsis aurantiaca]|uniref:Meiosis protein SPO22/ZIP4 like-domain-containing protein n=1 Tax=Hygrophoropsis aurantiaca TaxID=72124 RepID=A0ACB8A0K1_9AGAM|nr:meiosis protein SPO22/ZIP4 like-domain-containing protein [Hygrophoropsis aurantiaca]